MDQIRLEIRQGRLQRTMAVLAAFAALVSGFEATVQHQRGAFRHWQMWTPALLALPAIAAAAAALVSERVARGALPLVSLASTADGIVGFGLHIRGIRRLPGGFKLGQYNVVMGPPIFAPLLLCTVGGLGLLSGWLRREELLSNGSGATAGALRRLSDGLGLIRRRQQAWNPSRRPVEATPLSSGRSAGTLVLFALFLAVLSGGEVYFEHLRGSFNRRLMWAPVWGGALLSAATLRAVRRRNASDQFLLAAAVISFTVGLVGFIFHLRGIKNMPGGFLNIRFNITLGPPLFAPLLFVAAGLIGLIARIAGGQLR